MTGPVPDPLLAAWAPVYAWAPSAAEIGALIPAYTRGGYDDDAIYAGAEQGTFSDTTSPTLTEVQGLIDTACEEIAGRVGVLIPAAQEPLARATAKWHVCMTIAQNKMPAGTDDASGEYRAFNSNFIASLNSLIALARMPAPTRLK